MWVRLNSHVSEAFGSRAVREFSCFMVSQSTLVSVSRDGRANVVGKRMRVVHVTNAVSLSRVVTGLRRTPILLKTHLYVVYARHGLTVDHQISGAHFQSEPAEHFSDRSVKRERKRKQETVLISNGSRNPIVAGLALTMPQCHAASFPEQCSSRPSSQTP